MIQGDTLSVSARQLREGDNDRFLTALFAPDVRREGLFALYAFNLEVARIAELVSEPLIGLIRLQWWRDRIGEIYDSEPPKGADVAQALCNTVRAHHLPRQLFDAMLDARELDVSGEPPASLEDFESYGKATSGALVSLALRSLGVADEAAHQAAQHLGLAWAVTGHLRAAAFYSRRNKQFLPMDYVTEEIAHDLRGGRSSAALQAAVRGLAERATMHLDLARGLTGQIPKAALPALLLGPLARAYLRRLASQHYDLFSPRLELSKPRRQVLLAWAAARGRF